MDAILVRYCLMRGIYLIKYHIATIKKNRRGNIEWIQLYFDILQHFKYEYIKKTLRRLANERQVLAAIEICQVTNRISIIYDQTDAVIGDLSILRWANLPSSETEVWTGRGSRSPYESTSTFEVSTARPQTNSCHNIV